MVLITFAPMLLLFTESLRTPPYVPLWLMVVILIQFVILMYLFIYFPNVYIKLLLSIFDRRVKREMMESYTSFQTRLLGMFDIIFYLSFSLLLFFLFKENNFFQIQHIQNNHQQNFDDIKIYLLILFGVIILVFLKKQTFSFLAYLFNEVQKYSSIIFNINSLIRILGVVMFPYISVVAWGGIQNYNSIHYILIFNILVYLFIFLFSFLQIVHKSFLDYINFILYFCALEILPVLFILKFLL